MCHLNARPENDFVFREGLAFTQKDARATAALWMEGDQLSYSITASALSGPITAAHFHHAAAGAEGPAIETITFEGNSATGSWMIPADMLPELKAGKIYVNIHTAANPGGEVRGQIFPASVFEGLEVSFSRSISGRDLEFGWNGLVDETGNTSVSISNSSGSRRGTSGYYHARLTNIFTRRVVASDWSSVPVHDGRAIELILPVGGRAGIAGPRQGIPIGAAGKAVTGTSGRTLLNDIKSVSPTLALGPPVTTDGTLQIPIQVTGTGELLGGELALVYDRDKLTYRGARSDAYGSIQTNFDQSATILFLEGFRSDQTGLTVTFDVHGTGYADLKVEGLFFDGNDLPVAEVITESSVRLGGALPTEFALYQNHPNPFNPSTQIRYDLPKTGHVRLTVYNALGQEVAELVNAAQAAGLHAITWDAREMASGMYHYKLESGPYHQTRQLLLLK